MPAQREVKTIQQELLIALKEFHKICASNNIKYSLHAGTLLGAIREHGFIPWDDDVDVSMTREEYEKFLTSLSSMALPECLRFRVTERWPMLVLQRAGRPCVSVDIFINDGISKFKVLQKLKYMGIMLLGGMLKEKSLVEATKAKNKYGRIKYVLFYLAFLIGRPFSRERKYRWFDNFTKEYFCGDGSYIHRSNDQYRSISIILPKSFMESYMLVPFEDTELMVSKNWHEILVSGYGKDYMIPRRVDESEIIVHEMLRNYNARNSTGN